MWNGMQDYVLETLDSVACASLPQSIPVGFHINTGDAIWAYPYKSNYKWNMAFVDAQSNPYKDEANGLIYWDECFRRYGCGSGLPPTGWNEEGAFDRYRAIWYEVFKVDISFHEQLLRWEHLDSDFTNLQDMCEAANDSNEDNDSVDMRREVADNFDEDDNSVTMSLDSCSTLKEATELLDDFDDSNTMSFNSYSGNDEQVL